MGLAVSATRETRAGRAYDEAFMEFVRERSLALRRTAYLLCGSWADGDDLVQESLSKVYVAWPRIEGAERAAFSYTRTTMLRTYLNTKRKFGREVTLSLVPERPVDDHDAALAVTLSALLRELPDKQRAVLVLRFYQDLSVPQIAVELGLPEGTVKSTLSRGLAAMRVRLDEPTDHSDPIDPQEVTP